MVKLGGVLGKAEVQGTKVKWNPGRDSRTLLP